MSDSYPSQSLQKSKKKKSRCITFRLEAGIVEELTKESEQKEISLNVLVNQILRRYSEWDRYENKVGIIPVPRAIMTALIEKSLQIGKEAGINDLDMHRNLLIKEAASVAFESLRESVLFMKNQFNLFSVLSTLEEYMKVCGINSEHKFDSGR
ncbi:MAG TPA: hypothetical protein VLA74_09855, partial [Nitrososphaeraceae archaeon]|nr:hypothetical protein [Nitrososphaeraceae archaeon]